MERVINLVPHTDIFRALFTPTGEERAAFLAGHKCGDKFIICHIWPTENRARRDKRRAYAIGWRAWREARQRATRMGMEVVGHAHSHPEGGVSPSQDDLHYIRPGEIGLIMHPRGMLGWYTRKGMVAQERMRLSWWQRLLGAVFYEPFTDE